MEWTLVTRKIKDLKPHPRNARCLSKHDYKQLSNSLDKFGLIDKPIVTQEGQIIGGHQRIEVLKKKGFKTVECWQPARGSGLTSSEIDELNLRLNRNHGEWDWDILANEWDFEVMIESGFNPGEMAFGAREPMLDDEPKQCEKCPTCGKKIKAK